LSVASGACADYDYQFGLGLFFNLSDTAGQRFTGGFVESGSGHVSAVERNIGMRDEMNKANRILSRLRFRGK
jgi:hypothetical protein